MTSFFTEGCSPPWRGHESRAWGLGLTEESPGRVVSELCQVLLWQRLLVACPMYILPFFLKYRTMILYEAAIYPAKNYISQSLPVKWGPISKFRTKSCEWKHFVGLLGRIIKENWLSGKYTFFPFLLSAAWSIDAMAGTPAAVLNHDMTFSIEGQDGSTER